MKLITVTLALFVSSSFFAQEIKTSEDNVGFNNGSHNAIIVTIPFGNKDIVEKELKSEMKDWGGKYDNGKSEMSTSQSHLKGMGEFDFNAYGKVMDGGDNYLRVAVAIDLGGAYMTSNSHSSQYKYMREKIEKFAAEAAISSIDDELDTEGKVLRGLEKDKSDFEKDIERSKGDIEDYKKRITEAEQKIRDNESNVSKKSEEIKTQSSKIGAIEKKKKSVK